MVNPEFDWLVMSQWELMIEDLVLFNVPRTCRFESDIGEEFWKNFFTVCVVFSPPENDLLGITDFVPLTGFDDRDRLLLLSPLVTSMVDVEAANRVWQAFHLELMDELERRLLPCGVDVRQIVTEILEETDLVQTRSLQLILLPMGQRRDQVIGDFQIGSGGKDHSASQWVLHPIQ